MPHLPLPFCLPFPFLSPSLCVPTLSLLSKFLFYNIFLNALSITFTLVPPSNFPTFSFPSPHLPLIFSSLTLVHSTSPPCIFPSFYVTLPLFFSCTSPSIPPLPDPSLPLSPSFTFSSVSFMFLLVPPFLLCHLHYN